MQISTDSQIQNIKQTQKVQNQNNPQAQSNPQKSYEQLASNQSQNTNIEAQLKQTLLNFLQNLSNNTQTKAEIFEMLKNTNLFKDFTTASSLLKSILTGVQNNPSLKSFTPLIQSFLTNIENLNSESLKQNISNSGVFLESKLLQNQKQEIASDMKAVLLNLKKELDGSSDTTNKELLRQVDKMLIQIDYYQLLSLTSNSQFSYLPFDWDMLEEGDLSFYKDQDEFVCNINLTLKEYGEMMVSLRLIDDKSLSINFFIKDKEFQEQVRENFPKLRQSLQKQGFLLSNLSLKEVEEKTPSNPYASKDTLSINLDIRA